MRHYQDKETGKIYAFEDDYDPFTANNRNIPTTLTEVIKPKPDGSHVWYQGDWIKQEDAPPGCPAPISSVPSYNPAWMVNLRPYTAVYLDASSRLNITIDQINANSYDGGRLAEVVATLPLGNASGIPALVSYDGAIAIPQCDDFPSKADGVGKLNEILCCLLLGGIHAEVLHSADLVIGALHEKKSLVAYTPSLQSYLRLGWAALPDRLQPLMHPRILMVDDIRVAYSQGGRVTQAIGNFSPFFLLNGYTAMMYRNNSDALSSFWITIEQLTEYIWAERYEKDKHNFPRWVAICHRKANKAIRRGEIWAKQRQLRLAKIIGRDCHRALCQARVKRNGLAHRGIAPDSQLIALLWSALPELIEAASGIRPLGIRRLDIGGVESWGIPPRTNFDEWAMLAADRL